jgi:2-phospho-L-lactate/phosphoenolpyruvate guanylyltransferase
MPIKAPARAKRRLAEGLAPDVHRRLTEALLQDALDLCLATPEVTWFVVSDDDGVGKRAEDAGLSAVPDEGRGLNEAVRAGLDAAKTAGAEMVVVVPGDVPLAQPEDVQDILDTGEMSDVVVVPAADGGTNGLYLRSDSGMEPRFGPESLRVHVEEAQERGLRCTILELPRLALDLDTPEDAREILAVGEGSGRTLEVLRELFG